MSLPKLKQQRTFFDSDQALGRLLAVAPRGAERFVFFAEHIWPELVKRRKQLEQMYCLDNGRPAEEPVRMAAVTILQFMERLPDRQAAEACTWDGRWKLALHMEVDEPGFHPTTLVKFRNRLLDYGLERIGFDGVLNAMREAGYLPKRTRQRLDSSHMVGLVSSMSRLECVRETVRLALEALEPIEWLSRPEIWPVWWERYVDSKLDYKTDAKTLRLKMDQAGRDARDLSHWLREQEASGGRLPRQAVKAVGLLERVYTENFEEKEDDSLNQRRSQPPKAVHNPHDPEAQWSSKGSTTPKKEWVGYKAQVAETVEQDARAAKEPTRVVITAVVTQEATASDKAALPVVEADWLESGQEKPGELYVDGGYTSGAEVSRAGSEGWKLKGPMAPPPRKEGRLSSETFNVSIAERKTVCPAGQASTNCSRLQEQKTGRVAYRFEWTRAQCDKCALRSRCLGKGQRHRTRTLRDHSGPATGTEKRSISNRHAASQRH